tara:strand:+ start:14070 stop:15638 length:1569 start_codon:yes stop_codon:yes gene_type:complete
MCNWPKKDYLHSVVSAEEMMLIENNLFSEGMPEPSLMEKVGISMSQYLLDNQNLLDKGVLVLIGPGHNGGDGAILARELFLKDVDVSFWCPFPIKKQLTSSHVEYIKFLGIQEVENIPDVMENKLWIEALFGINQKRNLPYELNELFHKRELLRPNKLISLDVPAGISSDTGELVSSNPARASITLTVGLIKQGLLQDIALPYVGKIEVIDIGLKEDLISSSSSNFFSITPKDFSNLEIPKALPNSGKYERGRTLIIAGSEKYKGAAYLALKGSLSSSVGSIKTIIPKNMGESLWQLAPEVVIEASSDISLEGSALFSEILKNINFSRFDSILLGPGIGIDKQDWEKSMNYFLEFKGLLVIDADGLNRISLIDNLNWLRDREGQTWLTPHFAEFRRLFPNVNGDSLIQKVRNAAIQSHSTVLLKGANSLISDTNGNLWQISGTNPNCARAGFGDLLSGFLAGMGAYEIACNSKVIPESLAKYALLHAIAGCFASNGTEATIVGDTLKKIVVKKSERCHEKDI